MQLQTSEMVSVKRPKVAVVILNWNGKGVTLDCLESLSAVDYPNLQVIVVDNGSHDGSPEAFRENYPQATVIENGRNLGFTGGNNVGIQRALADGADYVMSLNNDTVVDVAFLDKLVAVGERDSRIGVLCPKIYYYDKPDTLWFAGGYFSFWRGKSFSIGQGEPDNGQYDQPRDISFATGCAFLAKRKVVEDVGMYDDRFFIYFEDADLTLRVLEHGFRVVYVPSAKVWHKCSSDVQRNTSVSVFQYYHGVRNNLLLMRKHAKFIHWTVFGPQFLGWVIYKVGGLLLLRRFDKAAAILRGIKDFLASSYTPLR